MIIVEILAPRWRPADARRRAAEAASAGQRRGAVGLNQTSRVSMCLGPIPSRRSPERASRRAWFMYSFEDITGVSLPLATELNLTTIHRIAVSIFIRSSG
jgi:hypothetical protein